jgi:signal peptidase
VGEVVVFKLDGRNIPIVHRVLSVHERYPPALSRPPSVALSTAQGPQAQTRWLTDHTTRRPNGEFDLLTKGDNNQVDDRSGGIYPHGQMWLNERHIIGRARGCALPPCPSPGQKNLGADRVITSDSCPTWGW